MCRVRRAGPSVVVFVCVHAAEGRVAHRRAGEGERREVWQQRGARSVLRRDARVACEPAGGGGVCGGRVWRAAVAMWACVCGRESDARAGEAGEHAQSEARRPQGRGAMGGAACGRTLKVCGSTELCGGLCGVARVCAFASSGRCEEGRRVRGAEADERRAREQRARPAPKTARREPAGSSSVKTRVLRRQGTDERFLRFVVTARDFQVASLGCRGGDRWRAWVGVSRRRRSGRA